MDMMGNGMDEGKGFNEKSLSKKRKVVQNLSTEDITVKNCQHAKRVWGKGIGGRIWNKRLM